MYKNNKLISIMLGVLTSAGVIGTAVLTAKETPKAIEKINELKSNTDKVKFKDYVKNLAPIYWPAATVCLATILSNTASSIISIKTEASLIATATMISQGYKKYKNKVVQLLGKEVDQKITTEISKDDYKKKLENKKTKLESDEEMYWEEHIGFFSCKPIDLQAALCDLNQRINIPRYAKEGIFNFVTLQEFLFDAKAKVYNSKILKPSSKLGWSWEYIRELHNIHNPWIFATKVSIVDSKTGELLYNKLEFIYEPVWLQEFEYEYTNPDDDYPREEDYEYLSGMDRQEFLNSNINFNNRVEYSDGSSYSDPTSEYLDMELPDPKTVPDLSQN